MFHNSTTIHHRHSDDFAFSGKEKRMPGFVINALKNMGKAAWGTVKIGGKVIKGAYFLSGGAVINKKIREGVELAGKGTVYAEAGVRGTYGAAWNTAITPLEAGYTVGPEAAAKMIYKATIRSGRLALKTAFKGAIAPFKGLARLPGSIAGTAVNGTRSLVNLALLRKNEFIQSTRDTMDSFFSPWQPAYECGQAGGEWVDNQVDAWAKTPIESIFVTARERFMNRLERIKTSYSRGLENARGGRATLKAANDERQEKLDEEGKGGKGGGKPGKK